MCTCRLTSLSCHAHTQRTPPTSHGSKMSLLQSLKLVLVISVAILCTASARTVCENNCAAKCPGCLSEGIVGMAAWMTKNTACGSNADKAACEGGDGTCEYVETKSLCVAKSTDYCAALYDKAKCLNAISCWPKINAAKYSDISDVDQRIACKLQALLPEVPCEPTICDAGSRLVPSSLVGFMAFTAIIVIADIMV